MQALQTWDQVSGQPRCERWHLWCHEAWADATSPICPVRLEVQNSPMPHVRNVNIVLAIARAKNRFKKMELFLAEVPI
jgi:hypothetical protein